MLLERTSIMVLQHIYLGLTRMCEYHNWCGLRINIRLRKGENNVAYTKYASCVVNCGYSRGGGLPHCNLTCYSNLKA